jgi:Phage integrase, N-terminal SAM-like domain
VRHRQLLGPTEPGTRTSGRSKPGNFGEWAERWYATTAHLKPSTRRDYRALLDHQVLPAFGDSTLAAIDTLAETHEARIVRMPRPVAEAVDAALATRPHDQDALVFTAPMGGPLERSRR